MDVADIQININRYTELHKGIERARIKLMEAKPTLTADTSNSLALPAFRRRVEELADLVDAYAARVEADSRVVYQLGMQFMDQDDALAKAYASTLASSFDRE